ncbi:hypothetical protein [Ferrovibrio sp.]|uniref:Spy/CpxP family protein refolding chaperone n=1 Tax=Ferrovibrio sp. TaxID=1917215 RepID=UPI0025B8EA3A|nr:hypothetical protein [Ferrovibrio sp.]MBX3455668.1 hypothetical protein [Ferrovibrio sp.]
MSRSLAAFILGALLVAGAAYAGKQAHFQGNPDIIHSGAPSPYDSGRLLALIDGQEYGAVAERSSYPDPQSVLDMADTLNLSDTQRLQMRGLQQRLQGESTALARKIAALEKRLQQSFADDSIDQERIEGLSARIGELEGKQRAAYLQAHLEAKALLDAEQVLRFTQLRAGAAALD